MPSKNTIDLASSNYSLGEAATQFLLTLSSEERLRAQQEVYKFVRWYGEKRPLSGLAIPEVANYAEQITSSTTEVVEKLGTIKTFLAYAHKQGLTKTNLAVYLKSKKSSLKSSAPLKRSGFRFWLLCLESWILSGAKLNATWSWRAHFLNSGKHTRICARDTLQNAGGVFGGSTANLAGNFGPLFPEGRA